ncbi:MAG TPA: FISUMP domain-containing protein [Bacteroidales bacterium]|nr:FISUMP domain-containing protein [Bacteroidales bacterium]
MKAYIILFLFFVVQRAMVAQVGINSDGSQPASSAMLDVKSTTKGFLPPRLNTVQRDAISSPEKGLVIYNSDCNDLQFFDGGGWAPLGNFGILTAPGFVNGPTLVCPYTTGVTYVAGAVDGATGYHWVVPAGTVISSGQGNRAIVVDFDTTGGTICVYAFNNCWKSAVRCLDVFLGTPATPQPGTHLPAKSAIQWNWTAAQGATGYKWNVVNDYATATDLGNVLTYNETQLTCNTLYTRFLWAYNTCSPTTAVPLSQATLSCIECGGTVTDTRDGKVYTTVAIGNQCWLRENMDIGTRIDGTEDQTDNQTIEKYCYNDDESMCDIYGGLYQWGELVQYLNGASNSTNWIPEPTGPVRGVCPPGWHIPNESEWCLVAQTLDPTVDCSAFNAIGTDVGDKMKEAGTAHWSPPNTGATNSSGFTALPGGQRYESGSFSNLTFYGIFWTATTTYELSARFRRFNCYDGTVFRSWEPKTNGFSVRCLRDD